MNENNYFFVNNNNALDESDDDQNMPSLLSYASSNDDDDQSIEIDIGLNELFQMLFDDSNTDNTFNAQDVGLRNDGSNLGSKYDTEEPYDTMDPINMHRTLQQDDFDEYVTSSKDLDIPLAEGIEEVSKF
eukprot:6645413-Ditylum_brightwellii.AAC.1